ncbi:BRO-N domain containing protein [Acanthamoeba polyphaga moumouvirus]|uniref:BRO-N domain containing protein n=1 Tax=Acanthamoeba polyphaga moumouvirus TaxID=1269028 RepID=L7RH06_9VIRU|nr:BRO-N domain containing protein [Acanthamoeba polyphaga moumouvirus]AGC02440.1 BRO-N domain containing protein [Acanthamoeba polyphaga moumouvirus]
MNKNKLFEILRENNVRISTKGNICLRDFVENIIESKNPSLYIKKLKYDIIIVKDNEYIKLEDCFDILKNTKFKKCKDIYHCVTFNDQDKSSFIDPENNIFQYEGRRFISMSVKNNNGEFDIWVKGSDVAKYLGYKNPSEAINDNVGDNNIICFNKMVKLFPESKNMLKLDDKTIFINLEGLSQLVSTSKKHKSIAFAKFLNINAYYKKIYHETQLMSQLTSFFDASDIKYIDQYSVKNKKTLYRIDCYLPEYNIAIEIDERGHSDRDPKYEIRRQKFLEDKLNCTFIRCNPDDPKFNVYDFLGKINKLILNFK